MHFNELGLSAELLRAVDASGYSQVTAIQGQAIPHVLAGRDVLAAAQTGTGKTAAFTLPLLHNLMRAQTSRRSVRVLILAPTRELASQIEQSVRDYGRFLPFRSLAIFGGVSINTQFSKLKKGVDIVVATPGRLLDHLAQKSIDLSAVEAFVLDEADRMLDMGFIRDIRKVMKSLPAKRQNLLFSATFPTEIRRLATELLHSAVEVQTATPNSTVSRVRQIVHPVDRERKRALLSHRIGKENWRQVLVFLRTKRGADRLARQLCDDGLEACAIHGNKSQGARTRALAAFKSGHVRILVATDIAARGLDIDRLPHVVNYELPHVPEDYVHRIGRTARAGQDGHAVSLVCVDEYGLLRDIEKLLKCSIEKRVIDGYAPDPRVKAEPIHSGRSARATGKRGKARRSGPPAAVKHHHAPQPRRSGRQRRAG